eukprot:110768_1
MTVPDVNGLVLSIFGIISILPPLLHLIFSNKHSKIKFKRIDTASSLLALLCYFFYSLHFGTLSIYGMLYDHTDHFSTSACVGIWYAAFWFSGGRFFTLVFFISRLYKTFHGSAFAISRKQFMISIIAYLFCTVAASICMSLQTIRPMHTIFGNGTQHSALIESIHSYEQCHLVLDVFWPQRKRLTFIAIGIWTIIDIVSNVVLLRIYLKKVVLLSIACNEINSAIPLQTKRANTSDRHVLKENTLFLQLAEKTTMIVILLTVSYFVVLPVQAMRVGQVWVTVENVIHSWCIYMTYKCAKQMYNIICFNGELCFTCWKRCCFCCCQIKQLPQELQLMIDQNSMESSSKVKIGSCGTATSTSHAGAATSPSVDITLDTTCTTDMRVPRLRLTSIQHNNSFFVEKTSTDYSQTPNSNPVLIQLPTSSQSVIVSAAHNEMKSKTPQTEDIVEQI